MKKKRLKDLVAIAFREAIWAQGRLLPDECEVEREKLFALKKVIYEVIDRSDSIEEITQGLERRYQE